MIKRIILPGAAIAACLVLSPVNGLAETAPVAAAIAQPATTDTKVDPDAVVDAAIIKMNEMRVFQVLTKHVPGFEAEMRERLKTVLTTTPQYQWYDQVAMASQAVVQKYFMKYMPLASDESIFAMVKNDKAHLDTLQSKPDICVAYYLGSTTFIRQAEPGYIEHASDLKADVFESAFEHPVTRPQLQDVAGAVTLLRKAYADNGFNAADLVTLGSLSAAPATDGCRAVTELTDALISLGPKDGAYVLAALSAAAASRQ